MRKEIAEHRQMIEDILVERKGRPYFGLDRATDIAADAHKDVGITPGGFIAPVPSAGRRRPRPPIDAGDRRTDRVPRWRYGDVLFPLRQRAQRTGEIIRP